MANIYSNAAVTIAASDALNSTQGFLHNYPPADADVTDIDVHAGLEREAIAGQTTLECTTETPWVSITITSNWGTNLSERGWPLQERHLSNRILSFRTHRIV